MNAELTSEIASLNVAADALCERVSGLTSNLLGRKHDNIVQVLYEVERALSSAGRQLARAERLARAAR